MKVLTAKYPFKRMLLFILSCGPVALAQETVPASGLFQLFVEEPGTQPFYSDKKGVFAKKGMVASAHQVASHVGADILKKGGNAIDAAIATHFALAVVFPFAGNLGGGGFAVVRDKNGQSYSLDFREKAPLAAHRDMYLDAAGNPVATMSTLGHGASGIPGSVAGMEALHKKLGSLSWKTLLEPAIYLAPKRCGTYQTRGPRSKRHQSPAFTS
jgi:gamma-glutamyltranspeptidase / glutathione hydrolase